MSELRAVAYLSSTASTLSDAELDTLLADARTFNESVGVTGVLLYNGGAFFQYFEGDADSCETVLDRIRCSSKHHAIAVLIDEATQTRHFSDWTMAFSLASTSQLLALSQAQWLAGSNCGASPPQTESVGVLLLKDFWRVATGSTHLKCE